MNNITVEKLDNWFINLSLIDKLIALADIIGYSYDEVLNMTATELKEILFVGEEKVTIDDIQYDWQKRTNNEKLDSYVFFNQLDYEEKLNLVDKNDADNYFSFLEKRDKCDILNIIPPYSIYDDKYFKTS